MRVSRMTKGNWNKTKAYFDLETSEGFTIKGFRIVDGIKGLFVSMPSQRDKEGEYKDTIFANKLIREELNKIALDYYNSDQNSRAIGGVSEGLSNSDDRGDVGHLAADNVKSFEQDDKLPF